MYIIIFIIILAALVFVHELGHFLVAKLSGIRVDEFAIGFPPRLFSFKKGETRYAINLIPFGGYVKIYGEDYEDSDKSPKELPEGKRNFANKPRAIQALVLAAGIIFNVLFAWILLSIGYMSGMPTAQDPENASYIQDAALTITSVAKNSPAEKAGFKPGDKIKEVRDESTSITDVSGDKIREFTSQHADKPISINIVRGNEPQTVTVTPTVQSGDRATIGITMETLGTVKLPFFKAFWEGAKMTIFIVKETVKGIALFIYNIFVGQANVSDVTGPVGIAGLVNDATELGLIYLLTFTAFISINLAVINLIPFPALDGGRILFVAIEAVIRKRLNIKVVQITNLIGLALLLLLMVVVTFNDILAIWR